MIGRAAFRERHAQEREGRDFKSFLSRDQANSEFQAVRDRASPVSTRVSSCRKKQNHESHLSLSIIRGLP
jgi:hypothetical protein